MLSHYNTRDYRCYAELEFTSSPWAGPLGSYQMRIFDVDENRQKGILQQQTELKVDGKTVVSVCLVGGARCTSAVEWDALVKPYMDQ